MHQPRRLRRHFGKSMPINTERLEDIYFDDDMNKEIFERVAKKCYIPALKILLEKAHGGKIRFALGLSGIFIEQCNWWKGEIIDLIRDLVETGACELTAQTYYHSLASMISTPEFIDQINEQKRALKDFFNVVPSAAENTEFIYNNDTAKAFEEMGFKVVMTEGVDSVLGWRSPNYLYKAKDSNISLLMRNYRLSDDIGFRFTSREWHEWPLTAERYAGWLAKAEGDLIFLALDFETFGEHHWPESGILDFLGSLPEEVGKFEKLAFATPSQAASKLKPVDEIDTKECISWADMERDSSAWLMNEMQRHCFDVVRYLEPMAKSVGNRYLRTWRLFTTSDSFHYMSTKGGGAGAVHSYFSHYNSPIEGFLSFTWILTDYRYKVYAAMGEKARYFRMLHGDLPESHSFHFYMGFAKPLGLAVRNLNELREAIKMVDIESLEFHVARGDLSRWSREIIGCGGLSIALDKMAQVAPAKEKLRDLLLNEVNAAIKDAEERLYGKVTEKIEV